MLGYTPPEADPPRADPQGADPPGSRHPLGADPHQSRHTPGPDTPHGPDPPPQKQTAAYGQRAAGTHPTGMHSCYCCYFKIVSCHF